MKSLKNQGKVEELDRALAKAKLDNEKTAGEQDRFKHDLNVLNGENAHQVEDLEMRSGLVLARIQRLMNLTMNCRKFDLMLIEAFVGEKEIEN